MSTRRGNGSSLAENHNALIGEHRGLDGGGYGEGEAVTQDLPPSILTTARTPWEPEMDVEFPRMPKDKQKAVESSGYDKTCFIIKQCWPRLDKFTVVFTTDTVWPCFTRPCIQLQLVPYGAVPRGPPAVLIAAIDLALTELTVVFVTYATSTLHDAGLTNDVTGLNRVGHFT